MDTAWSRFKRTLTFRRKKKGDADSSSDGTKPHQWLEDEKKVREGTCSFQVKYLGNIEVSESRGMNVCEEAIKKLKARVRGKAQRAILYVSGDAIRVVDEITKLKSPTEQKGLIVDQTIEKVSFCSPDRNHEKAFAYICRDGTTRRWLCHGFMAVRDSGERLSHAVGCAFAVCLERKQARERDCAVKAEFSDNRGTTFTRIGSFRQTTLTEKLLDPQISQVAEPPPVNPAVSAVDSTAAIPRPRASEDLMYRRFASMRLPASASAYDYSAIPSANNTVSHAWNVPSSASATQFPAPIVANNPLLLPPPPSTVSSNFRRSTSLRLDGSAAANIIERGRPFVTQVPSSVSPSSQMPSSLSTSSQLGSGVGMLAFPRSSSANAGFSTPGGYSAAPSSVPPSIPEEDPWSSPPNPQVAAAADAVSQLCEQLTAGLLSSPSQQSNSANSHKISSLYSTVPVQNVQTPLNVMTNPPGAGSLSPAAAASPFGNAPVQNTSQSSSSAKNPFLAAANVSSTPLANGSSSVAPNTTASSHFTSVQLPAQQLQTSPYSYAPSVTTTYFPAPSQWQAFPSSNQTSSSLSAAVSPQQQQQQQYQQIQSTSLLWPSSAQNDPFAPSVGLVTSPVSSASNSNPFKDAPFLANI